MPQWLSGAVIFVLGLLVRALIAALILAAIVVPIAVALYAWEWLTRAADRASGLQRVGHVRWRRGLYYTPGHLWLQRRRDDNVRIGVDDVAQRVLPEIAAVTLPQEGAAVSKGDALGSIRCFDGTVVLRAPVTGIVQAVNRRLLRAPSLLHRDPYRRAWLVEMRPKDTKYQELPAGDRARTWLATEDQRLTEFLEHQLGVAAADGGELMVPPQRLLSPEQWDAVRKGFLDRVA
jgi:glycine cleavage system H lipoate-binding protein